MPRARRAALLGGGVSVYADLNFAAARYKVGTSSAGDLTALPGFTFTRASLAMGYDATGKLTYGPNNLCLQSQTFDNASWVGQNRTVTANTSVAPDGSTTADTVAGTGAGATNLRQDVAVPGVSTVVVSFYVKADTATTCTISDVNIGPLGVFDLSTGAVISGAGVTKSISSAGNGWYRCVVSYNPIAGFARAAISPTSTYNPTTTSAILVWGAQYEAVTYQTTPSTYYPTTTAAYYGPRLVYDPVTLASQGILVEEARTNLILQSQTLDNASWSKVGSAVTADQTTSPDGTSNADTITEDSSTGRHFTFRNTLGLSSSTTYTASVFLKYLSRQYVVVAMKTGASVTAYSQVVDVQNRTLGAATNTIGSPTATSSRIDLLPNGWCRVSLTIGTGADTNCFVSIGLSNSATPSYSEEVPTYTGNGTGAAYIYQAQLEAGTGASSPIPTTTASVTRAADDAVLTGLSLPGPCSFATDALAPAFVSTDARHTLSDGNTNNRLWLSYNGSILNVNAMVANTGVAPVTSPTVAPGVAFKAAQSSNNGTYLSVANGGTVETASGGVMPTLTRLDIGKNAASSLRYWNSPISRIRIYNRALSDAQLQSLTT